MFNIYPYPQPYFYHLAFVNNKILWWVGKKLQYQTKICKTDSRDTQSYTGKAKQDKCLYIKIDENPTLDVG